MTADDVAREYLNIARALNRLVPGTLDAYPPDPAPIGTVRPAALVRAAGRVADMAADVEPAERGAFLRAQALACEQAARRLAGQPVTFVDEVRTAFGVRIALGSEDTYRAVHSVLAAILPGPGSLAERMAAHRRRDRVPPARIAAVARAVADALQDRMAARLAVPSGQSVTFRVVADAPWSALHHYAGGYRSVVTLNAAAGFRPAQLVQLVAHEVYPGHHTERCRKEAGIVARGWFEHRAVVANTPQSLVAEGAAEIGLSAVVGPAWGRFAEEVLADAGVRCDGALAERIDGATSRLARVRQDAALLMHGFGRPEAEVEVYLRRWMLVDEGRARHVLRFLRDPLWRAYTVAYVEGSALVRRWWENGGDVERLLDEPLTPEALRTELARPSNVAAASGARRTGR